MKIIEAQITVRLGEGDDGISPSGELDVLLAGIGFEKPVNVTSIPSTEDADGVYHVSFEAVSE
jgi:hypothetical protein